MNDPSSKKALTYLNASNQGLKSIFDKIRQLQEIERRVAPYLDPDLKKYCQVANFNQHQLVFLVANGSVATQIRFQSYDLIRKFKDDPLLQGVREISCKVRLNQPATRTQLAPSKKMLPISKDAALMMNDIADTVDDPALKKALKKLAQNQGET